VVATPSSSVSILRLRPPTRTLFPYTTLFRSFECLQGVDMRRTDDGVTADTDCGGEPDIAQLEHHLIGQRAGLGHQADRSRTGDRSEEHTSELQSRFDLVCRLLLEKKKSSSCW